MRPYISSSKTAKAEDSPGSDILKKFFSKTELKLKK